MKPLGYAAMTLAVLALGCTIWLDHPIRWALTAVLLLIVGAAFLGNATRAAQETPQSDQNAASGAECHPVDSDAPTARPREWGTR